MINGKRRDDIRRFTKVETQNFASHKEVCACCQRIVACVCGCGWMGWYVLQVKVETQNFASHREVCACCQRIFACVCWYGVDGRRKDVMLIGGDDMAVVAAFIGRETQGCVCLSAYFRVRMLVWDGRETQDFASLLLGMRC